MCCTDDMSNIATITRAEEIIEAAKTIRRKECLAKAQVMLEKKRQQ